MAVPNIDTLVLGGGNALGSYQAGAYAALSRRDVTVDRIIGASAGAINGALIAGNALEDRIDRLRAFWRPGTVQCSRYPKAFDAWETMRRTLAATWSLTAGRSGVFAPRADPLWQELIGSQAPSIYSTAQLATNLVELVDFDLLNGGSPRYCATALNLETGEDVAFDTDTERVTVDHVLASAALPPAFPPIEIEKYLFVDAGLSANLPIDQILGAPNGTSLCVVIDLLPLAAPRPVNLGALAERAQDLIFAAQSRRSLASWQKIFDARTLAGDPTALTLIHLQYANQDHEVAGKAFDFSPASAALRWARGERDMDFVIDQLERGAFSIGAPGLKIVSVAGRTDSAPQSTETKISG